MKIKQLIVLGAAACISFGATANTSSDKELQLPKKQVAKLKFDNNTLLNSINKNRRDE